MQIHIVSHKYVIFIGFYFQFIYSSRTFIYIRFMIQYSRLIASHKGFISTDLFITVCNGREFHDKVKKEIIFTHLYNIKCNFFVS